MVYRVRFAKYGVLKFIGHLDVMRYFQKVVRRSNLPVKYSQGFTPHQILSFALPLGLGVTSDGEYMEIEFTDDSLTEQQVFDALSANTTDGFEILGVKELPRPLPNTKQESAMSLVTGAKYLVSFKDGYELPFSSQEELDHAFEALMACDTITVNKKTKKSEADIDVKPYIYPNDKSGLTKHADVFENGITLTLTLAAGSKMNIKPELVMEALCEHAGREYNENAVQYHRCELYKGEKKLKGMNVFG